MQLTKNAEYILKTLERAGYRAYVVGGPVRDFLLGKTPSDYDITTSARPEEVKAVFAAHRTVDTGIKHGTVSLILDGEPYEITTYRVDGEYKDSRHPESVTFAARVEDDLARRDFTVNAMAYGLNGEICDPFSGRSDLAIKTIRAVGEPHLRFSEDALRILRGIRFASVLGFEIEEQTAAAMRALAPTLDKISAERIYTEWTKLLSGDGAYRVIKENMDIITVFLPELSGAILPDERAFLKAAPTVRQLALFASLECPSEKFAAAMSRLKSPAAIRDDGATVLSRLDGISLRTDSDIGRLLYSVGEGCARELVSLVILLAKCDEGAKERLESYILRALPYRISDLAIGGRELMSIGIRGRALGDTLNELLLAVIDGEVENTPDALISFVKTK